MTPGVGFQGGLSLSLLLRLFLILPVVDMVGGNSRKS